MSVWERKMAEILEYSHIGCLRVPLFHSDHLALTHTYIHTYIHIYICKYIHTLHSTALLVHTWQYWCHHTTYICAHTHTHTHEAVRVGCLTAISMGSLWSKVRRTLCGLSNFTNAYDRPLTWSTDCGRDVCTHVCMYVCMYVCMSVYIFV
jgi:hypothetical protein